MLYMVVDTRYKTFWETIFLSDGLLLVCIPFHLDVIGQYSFLRASDFKSYKNGLNGLLSSINVENGEN